MKVSMVRQNYCLHLCINACDVKYVFRLESCWILMEGTEQFAFYHQTCGVSPLCFTVPNKNRLICCFRQMESAEIFSHGVILVDLQLYFHVTKKCFHAAHVSTRLHKLSLLAFPVASDTGYTFTLKLTEKKNPNSSLLAQLSYFPSAVIK